MVITAESPGRLDFAVVLSWLRFFTKVSSGPATSLALRLADPDADENPIGGDADRE